MLELSGAVLFLILASALCSGIEAAIFSLPLAKARQLAEKNSNGKTVCHIREHPARPISTIVIGNNLANIVGTFIVASLATKVLNPSLQAWFPFVLTAMVIVFSEIIPKTVGERYHKPIICFVARPLSIITWFLTPLVWCIEKLIRLLIGSKDQLTTSESEIRALVKIGHQEGVIDEDERHMIGRVFELDDEIASRIMTPRMAMTWVYADAELSSEVIQKTVANSEHSRLVVVGKTPDDVKGVLLKSRFLKWVIEFGEEKLVSDLMEPIKLIPEDTAADDLLNYFKNSRMHLAVVVDAYGGVSGVVTLEDVLEVLTGEIMDETDRHEDMRIVALENGAKKLGEQTDHQVLRSSSE